MRRLGALVAVAVLVGLTSVPGVALAADGSGGGVARTGDNAPIWKDGQTVVTFTFDGGYKDQDLAADILAKHNLAGTFYVNSGYIGYPAYMTTEDLRDVARNRSEIGGGSLFNDDLGKVPPSRAHTEVCDDRATLSQLGFQVTSFSYPYGDDSAAAKAAVQGCGYNNARSVSGLYESPESCASCPHAETLPPTDDFRIRTMSESKSLAYIEQHISQAEARGGGWLPLMFTHVCVCTGLGNTGMSPADFEKLVVWVAREQADNKVKVLTVDQVMGGSLKPIIGQPIKRLMPAGMKLPPKRSLPPSQRPAWSLAGANIDQSQLIMLGISVSLAVVLTFRIATRGKRYEQHTD